MMKSEIIRFEEIESCLPARQGWKAYGNVRRYIIDKKGVRFAQ
jgi:hypothetical protein